MFTFSFRPPVRVLSVLVVVLTVGRCQADETLTLQGANPRVIFDDNDGTLRQWHILGNDQGFDIQRIGSGSPFRIGPSPSADSVCIAANNRIGFGTTSPQKTLHVATGNSDPTLRLEWVTDGPHAIWDLRGTSDNFDLVDVSSGDIIPFTVQTGTPVNTMVLADTGSVGIGTANPDTNSKLDIRSSLINGLLMKRSTVDAHYLRVENSAGVFRTGVQGNGDAQFGALSPGKGLNLLAGGATKLLMNSTGQISFGNAPPTITDKALVHTSTAHLTIGGTWTNASSRDLKQDIEPITSEQAREAVRALQPVGYRYKNELDERYVGFIAEDVPELVATSDRKGLAPMDITAVLTRVVQDQDKLNEQQQQTIDRQQQLIDSLSKRLADLEQKSERTE
ncbi:MAG: tail fiber domain-containing protein [Candidatus Saccharimonas sp.]|nr:tail fiber domain-containing protein [Planctomycetaceae bacterium]